MSVEDPNDELLEGDEGELEDFLVEALSSIDEKLTEIAENAKAQTAAFQKIANLLETLTQE